MKTSLILFGIVEFVCFWLMFWAFTQIGKK